MKKRRIQRTLWGSITLALVLSAWWGYAGARAQDNTLILLSVDETRPVLFQALAPGAEPGIENFTPRLEVPLDDHADQPVIYTAIENRGWSVGAVGLIGETLNPDETYVALELWERMGNLVLRDDGHTLIFPLVYVEDLDGDETPGFRLDAVINQGLTFRIYRVVDEGGLFVWGQTASLLDSARPQTERVSYQIETEPVFGDLLLEYHIIALPERIATPTPTPTPTLELFPIPAELLTPTP